MHCSANFVEVTHARKCKNYFAFCSLNRNFAGMKSYRLSAEWEPQELIQLTWPHSNTDWAPMLDEINATYIQMAREIAKREPLLIVVPHENDLPKEIRGLKNVRYFFCPTNDTWARDHAFITLLPIQPGKQETEKGKPLLLDFQFNGWGRKFAHDKDNCINSKLWHMTDWKETTLYENHNDFVLEGGSIECDGKGSVFTTTPCLLAPNRNQPLTKAEIEEQLKSRLRVERIVWLDYGQLVGDDTDGHIDTIVRLAPNDTILYVGCDEPDDEQYADFQALEAQLRTLRTTDGRPYRLLRLPMPAPIYDDGDRLPATYANFLVLNGAVLVPTYAQPATDEEAMRMIGSAFPERDIVAIDSRSIIRQHGSVHCCTMQYPKRNP